MKIVLAFTAFALAALTTAAPQGFHGPPPGPSDPPGVAPSAAPPATAAAAPGTVTLELEIAPDILTADTVVTIAAVFESDIMAISTTIAAVFGVTNRDGVTCVGIDQAAQINQPFLAAQHGRL